MIRPAEQIALDAIRTGEMADLLCQLVAIPSLDGSEGEVQVQETVAAVMHRFGLEVDRWEIDFGALSRHTAFSSEFERNLGLGVVGSLGEGDGPTLIFNGHVDVVPADDPANWHYPPWQGTLENGRIYGRGAVDMKGGLCCALFAARALKESRVPLKGRLLVQSVIGEEDGGCGTLASVLRGHTGDGAVILEPTGMKVVTSQAGALSFRITVQGLSAHGSMRRSGVSAIEKFLPIHQALLDLEARRNAHVEDPLMAQYPLPYALSIGNLRAGNWPSSVPESLVCEGRYGVAVGEDVAAAKRLLEESVAHAASGDAWLQEHPPRVEWWGGQFHPASIPPQHPLAVSVGQALADITGVTADCVGVPYGADLRLLVNQGHTPTVLFGPGDVRQAHRPDEYVPLKELEQVTRSLVLLAMRTLA